MWLVDEEMNVLFEANDQPGKLVSGPVDMVINIDLIQKYLDGIDHIPHIRKSFSLEPTLGLKVKDYQNN